MQRHRLLLLSVAVASLAILLPNVETVHARAHVGRWDQRPLFTPGCYNGAFPNTNQDATRTFCCSGANAACPAEYASPPIPLDQLPPYTKDNRRDHHHVIDGPVLGNGNIGVAVGSGNLWNVSYPWLDFYISTNSFWALTSVNKTQGRPFRGRISLPGTMVIGIARLSLPAEYAGCDFAAEQDVDAAVVSVNLTKAGHRDLRIKMWISPLAPAVWTEIAAGEAGSDGAGIELTLNTTVQDHFWEREANGYNTSFPLSTTAGCIGGADAAVSRDSDYAGSDAFNPHIFS